MSGVVRLVVHRATGVKYAVKVLDLGLIDTTEGLKQLRNEIFIMCQLDHPNIVRIEEVYESTNEIYIVQELCLGGDLFDRLDQQVDFHYTEAQCARLVKQVKVGILLFYWMTNCLLEIILSQHFDFLLASFITSRRCYRLSGMRLLFALAAFRLFSSLDCLHFHLLLISTE